MELSYKFKLNNNFPVSKFMENIKIDFLYSYDPKNENKPYKLLNQDMFGEIGNNVVDKQKKNKRVVVIELFTNVMHTYNIEESEVIEAFLKMGKF